MEALASEWLVIVMNAIVIALVLTTPLLVGIIIIRILRRGVTQDRRDFEDEIRSQLSEIAESIKEIKRQIEKTPKQ